MLSDEQIQLMVKDANFVNSKHPCAPKLFDDLCCHVKALAADLALLRAANKQMAAEVAVLREREIDVGTMDRFLEAVRLKAELQHRANELQSEVYALRADREALTSQLERLRNELGDETLRRVRAEAPRDVAKKLV